MSSTRDTGSRRDGDQASQAGSSSSRTNFTRLLFEKRAQQPPEEMHQNYVSLRELELSSQGHTSNRMRDWQDGMSVSSSLLDIETASQGSRKRQLDEIATNDELPHTKKMKAEDAKEILNNLEKDVIRKINDYNSSDIIQQKWIITANCERSYNKWKKYTRTFTDAIRAQKTRRESDLNDFNELKESEGALEKTKQTLREQEENPPVPGIDATVRLRDKIGSLQKNIDRLNAKLQGKNKEELVKTIDNLNGLLEERENQEGIINEIHQNFLSLQESQAIASLADTYIDRARNPDKYRSIARMPITEKGIEQVRTELKGRQKRNELTQAEYVNLSSMLSGTKRDIGSQGKGIGILVSEYKAKEANKNLAEHSGSVVEKTHLNTEREKKDNSDVNQILSPIRSDLLSIKQKFNLAASSATQRFLSTAESRANNAYRQLKDDFSTINTFVNYNEGELNTIQAALHRLSDHSEQAMGRNNKTIQEVIDFIKANPQIRAFCERA